MTRGRLQLYFEPEVMGMTVSTLLTSEVQQMLMEPLALLLKPMFILITPRQIPWRISERIIPKDETKENEVK